MVGRLIDLEQFAAASGIFRYGKIERDQRAIGIFTDPPDSLESAARMPRPRALE
jgi:hypothetical protein